MKTTKDGQLTYFAAIPIPTTDKGMSFLYMALDDYSGKSYNLGIAESLNKDILFKKIKSLLKHPGFEQSTQQLFTIMFPIGEEISDEFKSILGPNGNPIFDSKATDKIAEVLVEMGILGKME